MRILLESVLQELFRGPLKGKEVTLILDASSEDDVALHDFLPAAGVPALLFAKDNSSRWDAGDFHVGEAGLFFGSVCIL